MRRTRRSPEDWDHRWETSQLDLPERVRLLEEALVEHSRILSALCAQGGKTLARLVQAEAHGIAGAPAKNRSLRQ